MSQVNFSTKKLIQPLFPYTDRSVENILTEVDRRLKDTGIPIESIQPYIFEDSDKSHRLSNEDKFVIYNKIDRLIGYYTSSPIHMTDSGMLRVQENRLLLFKEKVEVAKIAEKDSEQQFQKMINKYKKEVDKIYANEYKSDPIYCLNHYINHSQPIIIKDHVGIRALNVHLWNFDFEAALDCLSRSSPEHPDRMDTELLTTVIRIFRNICLITSKDPDLKKWFFQRKINSCKTNDSKTSDPTVTKQVINEVSIPHNLLAEDLEQTDIQKVRALAPKNKISLLKQFLSYGIGLAKEMSEIAKSELDKKNNCYIPYLFLSNSIDIDNTNQPITTPPNYANYAMILQHPQLKEVDKFFFAFKFLRNTKFQQYKIKLERRLEMSSDLLELGLCHNIKLQAKIMQNYIDQTGDIKTIAILAVYEKIKTGYQKKSEMDLFIQKYENILAEFNQEAKLEEFKNKIKDLRHEHRTLGQNPRKDSAPTNQPKQLGEPFLYRLDLINKKIKNSVPRKQPNRFCWICRAPTNDSSQRTMGFAQDFYAECQKCRHGGHFKHLVLWFQNNIRCPVADCSCFCN